MEMVEVPIIAEHQLMASVETNNGLFARAESGTSEDGIRRTTSKRSVFSLSNQSWADKGDIILDVDLDENGELVPEPVSPKVRAYSEQIDTRHSPLKVHPTSDLDAAYELQIELGRGAYGVVRQAVKRDTMETVAVKSITHAHLSDCDSYAGELVVAWRMDHPHVVHLLETFHDAEALHFVMEFCSGGSLAEKMGGLVCNREPRGLPCRVLRRYMWDMLDGIHYLHYHRVAHRDCKPDNYMLASPQENACLKLIDFGLATYLRPGGLLEGRVGTPEFAAPEVIAGKGYDLSCDMWSIGVVAYFCAVGFLPFPTEGGPVQVINNVLNMPVVFHKLRWGLVMPEVQKIISEVLTKDPMARPSARELAEHHETWLTKAKSEENRVLGTQPDACCTIS